MPTNQGAAWRAAGTAIPALVLPALISTLNVGRPWWVAAAAAVPASAGLEFWLAKCDSAMASSATENPYLGVVEAGAHTRKDFHAGNMRMSREALSAAEALRSLRVDVT